MTELTSDPTPLTFHTHELLDVSARAYIGRAVLEALGKAADDLPFDPAGLVGVEKNPLSGILKVTVSIPDTLLASLPSR